MRDLPTRSAPLVVTVAGILTSVTDSLLLANPTRQSPKPVNRTNENATVLPIPIISTFEENVTTNVVNGGDSNASAASSLTCGGFLCSNIDLESWVGMFTLTNGGKKKDVFSVWGWESPSLTVKSIFLSSSSSSSVVHPHRAFALVGMEDRTAFVEVTDPSNPVYRGYLPSDPYDNDDYEVLRIETYGNYAYIHTYERGVQVFDLGQLVEDDTTATNYIRPYSEVGRFLGGYGIPTSVHIHVDTGYLYATGSDACKGLRIYDLFGSSLNPASPPLVNTCFQKNRWIASAHCVVYNDGPDTTYKDREICFAPGWDEFTIIDVTNKAYPTVLSQVSGSYAYSFYNVLQGSLTADRNFFVMAEREWKDGYIYVLDVRDLNNPRVVQAYYSPLKNYFGNAYSSLLGNYLYQVEHRAGLQVYEINSGTGALSRNVGYFDTIPYDNDKGESGVMDTYPFFTTTTGTGAYGGIVLIASKEDGLFIVRLTFLEVASSFPSASPSGQPSLTPSYSPSVQSSVKPTVSLAPSRRPSVSPSLMPSNSPSAVPSLTPSIQPSVKPTLSSAPSQRPSMSPSLAPSQRPSVSPSLTPSNSPSAIPSLIPSVQPSVKPTVSSAPSQRPSVSPSLTPSQSPSILPSIRPSVPPTQQPSSRPSDEPSSPPTVSTQPSAVPSGQPSVVPSTSANPSLLPTDQMSFVPSTSPKPTTSPPPTLVDAILNVVLLLTEVCV